MTFRLKTSQADFEAQFTALLSAKREEAPDVNKVVEDILRDVKLRGDEAVVDYTNKFDRMDITVDGLAITAEEMDREIAKVSEEAIAALQVASDRIKAFHAKQLPEDLDYTDEAGVRLGYRWKPIQAAGLYVPGGTASYPSSVLMNAIPAKVAGVDRLVMVVPTPDNVINPLVMAAARLSGVDEIYRIGGAQAVGALAYGTETIKPVDIIVGPGNAFVAAAKRQVFGTVGIDMIAGPSEILVIADNQNDPSWIAADLLSQAEHDTAAQSILITDDADYAEKVEQAVEAHLKTLPRAEIARQSWEDHGAFIVVKDWEEAVALTDRIAPEHLELALDNPDALERKIRNAGAVFMGRYTPEAIGDYVAGPNHVLPTARSARFSSGLGVLNFMKRNSLIQCDASSLNKIGPSAVALAKEEGLQAHGLSVAIRLNMER
ncbi:histidinol dehydrogenase [Terasakiella pusilla]|uniref:histidinol dehydrogenase n=1 Tax=Terasakiella pusilla TaxID=64973 RepID=UPI003AA9209A